MPTNINRPPEQRYNVRIKGFVLASNAYRESDRILTLLTKDHGLLTIHARHIKRKNNYLANLVALYTFAEFELSQDKGRYYLAGGTVLQDFSGLSSDPCRLYAIAHLAEVFRDLLRYDVPSQKAYELWGYASWRLVTSPRPLTDVRIAQLRALADHGFQPSLRQCALCQAIVDLPPNNTYLFSFLDGSVICGQARCRTEMQLRSDQRAWQSQSKDRCLLVPACMWLEKNTLEILRHSCEATYNQMFNYTLAPGGEQEFCRFTDYFLLLTMEKSYNKLDQVDDYLQIEEMVQNIAKSRKQQADQEE